MDAAAARRLTSRRSVCSFPGVVYTVDQADAVAKQLEKFSTCYVHQLVGQIANMEFWLEEAVHALKVADDYPARFATLRDAQREWVDAHGTRVSKSCPACRGKCEFEPEEGWKPQPPSRIDSGELKRVRIRLKDAVYRFALRGHRAGLLDEAALRAACDRVGTSVDAADLEEQAALEVE